ncbi:MAG: zinc ribbon domain-containing protein [Anaerolineaceae bacterium]|nr:zinc ribbon domain-containing protein [Anaerolineaceae bacterium]
MPIYEYQCQDCQSRFEQIRPIKDADSELECPCCQSHNVKRQVSLFNASSGGRPITSGGGCSGCSGGSCSTCGTHQ